MISIFLGLSFSCLRCKVEGLNCVAEEQCKRTPDSKCNHPKLIIVLISVEFSLASVSPAVGRAGVQRCVWYGNEKLGVQVCSLKVLKTLYEWLENLRQTSDWRTWLKFTSDSRKWLKLTSSCNWRRIKLQVFWPLHIFFYWNDLFWSRELCCFSELGLWGESGYLVGG